MRQGRWPPAGRCRPGARCRAEALGAWAGQGPAGARWGRRLWWGWRESRAGDTPDAGPMPCWPPAGPERTPDQWLLAAGCHPTSAGPERSAGLLQGLGLLAVQWAADLQSAGIQSGTGARPFSCKAGCNDLGLGLMSQFCHLPGQRQEGQLAAASDQAVRPGDRPLLGHKE